jgi:Taurine catabolism dioxygenase TauD, TfdA family
VPRNRQTGWKSIFAGVGLHVTRINGLYDYEEKMVRDYIMRLITHNHDCIARMHWTKGAAAIWNNSCVWHAATVSLPGFDSPMEKERKGFADNEVIAGYAFGPWCGEDGYSCEFYWGETVFGSCFYVEEGGFGDPYLDGWIRV